MFEVAGCRYCIPANLILYASFCTEG